MRPERVLRLAVLFFLGYLALSFIVGVLVAEATIHPRRRLVSAKDEVRAEEMAHSHEAELADVQIAARDGTTLSAWTIRPRNSNGKAIILLHGLSDNRLGMIGYAEMLLGHGFSVLAPDARAHGASGGQLATYGLLESEDIHRWFDWLQQNRTFALLLRNRLFQVSVRLPTIVLGNSSMLARGSGEPSSARLSRSHSLMLDGSTR